MVIVSLLNGTVMFLADLIRHISLPLRLDFIGVSSYGPGTESGELVFTKELRLDVRNRDEFERFRLEGRSPLPAVNIPYFEMLELGGKEEMLDSVVAYVERDLADRLPFDLPESEQELAGGYNVEYSSKTMSFTFAIPMTG